MNNIIGKPLKVEESDLLGSEIQPISQVLPSGQGGQFSILQLSQLSIGKVFPLGAHLHDHVIL